MENLGILLRTFIITNHLVKKRFFDIGVIYYAVADGHVSSKMKNSCQGCNDKYIKMYFMIVFIIKTQKFLQ